MYSAFIANLIPAWIPGRLFWAYAAGCGFFAASLSALFGKYTRTSGTTLSLMFLCWLVVLHIPRVASHPGSEPEVTSALVAMAMSGIGLLLAASASENRSSV